MSNYNLNERKGHYIKNDMDKIVKNTHQIKMLNIGILTNVILLILGIILKETSSIVFNNVKEVYLCLFLIVAFIPIIILCIEQLIFCIKEHSMRLKQKIGKFVDTFDNEICYYVIKSKSFKDILGERNNQHEINLKVFYYTQMCFYRNKAILELFKMIQYLPLVFDKNAGRVRSEKKVSVLRLENIMKLINEINIFIESEKNIVNSYSSKNVLLEENAIRQTNFIDLNNEIKEVFNINCAEIDN